MDAVNIALQLAFILIFIVVLARYLRQPRAVHRDLVLVFGSVVALFAIAIALTLWPTLPRGIASLSAVILLLQPYLTLRLARHFVPVSRSVASASLVWFVVAVLAVAIGTRGNVLTTAIVVGYFVTVEATAAFFLQRASRTRVGYARTRLRIASVARLRQEAVDRRHQLDDLRRPLRIALERLQRADPHTGVSSPGNSYSFNSSRTSSSTSSRISSSSTMSALFNATTIDGTPT